MPSLSRRYCRHLDSLRLAAVVELECRGEQALRKAAEAWTLTFTSEERRHALGEIDKLCLQADWGLKNLEFELLANSLTRDPNFESFPN